MTHKQRLQSSRSGQLVDLAAGELGPIARWRLRREIARDPALAMEWEEVRGLWNGLGALRVERMPVARPAWPDQPAGARSAGRRPVRPWKAALAGGLALMAVTGAVATGFWRNWVSESTWRDGSGRLWRLSGNFQGRTQIVGGTGGPAGEGTPLQEWFADEGDPNGVRAVDVGGLHQEFRGPGRYPVRDQQGTLLGYLELAAMTPDEHRRLAKERELETLHWERLYRGEADLAPGRSNPASLPGLVCGYDAQVSWVVRGYASVRITYFEDGKPRVERVASAPPPTAPAEGIAPGYRQMTQRMLAVLPQPDTQPEVRWTLHKPGDPLEADEIGQEDEPVSPRSDRWPGAIRRGVSSGYGVHEVRDGGGRLLLRLEIAPSKP